MTIQTHVWTDKVPSLKRFHDKHNENCYCNQCIVRRDIVKKEAVYNRMTEKLNELRNK